MARRDDAHVGPDHHIVGNVEPAQIIKSAILICENVAPNTDIDAAGCVERRQQNEQMQAKRDADSKARATANAAQQQLARDKALLCQMEIDHYGRVLVR